MSEKYINITIAENGYVVRVPKGGEDFEQLTYVALVEDDVLNLVEQLIVTETMEDTFFENGDD